MVRFDFEDREEGRAVETSVGLRVVRARDVLVRRRSIFGEREKGRRKGGGRCWRLRGGRSDERRG